MTDEMRNILEMDRHPVIAPVLSRLNAWEHWHHAFCALLELPIEHLYDSWTHGVGHTERVILLGAVCAMDQGFDDREARYTALACTWHDVGRRDDGIDIHHSRRSADRLPKMADYPAEDLALLRAAIRAHSGPDGDEACLAIYAPRDEARCRRVMKALQDADRLDRVRLGDLDPGYLNFDTSRRRVKFADALYEAYEDW